MGREFCHLDSYIFESLAKHLIRRRETFTGGEGGGDGRAVASYIQHNHLNFDLHNAVIFGHGTFTFTCIVKILIL